MVDKQLVTSIFLSLPPAWLTETLSVVADILQELDSKCYIQQTVFVNRGSIMTSSTMSTVDGHDLYFLNQKTKTTPIENDYKISNNVLGLGINGKVVQCFSIVTGEKFALKVNYVYQYSVV